MVRIGSGTVKKKKVTMQLIADRAGFSKYVVSKTLNGQPGVSEQTRKKILFIAKQLGYLKSEISDNQDLIDQDAWSDSFVLVVMPNHRSQNAESDYWSIIFNGVLDHLEEYGIGAVAISSKNNLSDKVKTSNLLGIITVGLVSTELLLELNKHQVPLIMVDHEDSIVKSDTIFMDNLDGVHKLTSHLIGLGHRSLIFVGQINFSKSFYDRWLGFRTALEKNEIDYQNSTNLINIEYNDHFNSRFVEVLEKLEKANLLPTGFVCANDQIATVIMNTLQERGYEVPGDVSVTGFDNLEKSSLLDPPLSSVQVLKEAIGKRAVSKLLWRTKNKEFPSERVSIASEIIIRASVGVPREKVMLVKEKTKNT